MSKKLDYVGNGIILMGKNKFGIIFGSMELMFLS